MMKRNQNQYDFHLLICSNTKEKGESCGPKGGQAIVDAMKEWSKEEKSGKKIRVNKSGCLGRCSEGVACVAYPKGEWVTEAREKDIPEIKNWANSLLRD